MAFEFIDKILAITVVLYPIVRADSVCYGSGLKPNCFSNEGPFEGLPLPQDPAIEIKPTYYLYRPSENTAPRLINDSIDFHLDEKHGSLTIITHSWTGDFPTSEEWLIPLVRNLFTVKTKTDVLFVEWAKGAELHFGDTPYAASAANSRSIGGAVADFLFENSHFQPKKSHCIGFGLGSHVCGFAGKRFKMLGATSGWGRITALDPSYPHFDSPFPATRLDRSDAQFVDVIHTSSLGLQRPVGHVDFFVSGGMFQPGCDSRHNRRRRSDTFVRKFLKNFTLAMEELFVCSHFRAPLIYTETILIKPNSTAADTCTFSTFCPCHSLSQYMSGSCSTCSSIDSHTVGYWSFVSSKLGTFSGRTSDRAPFCIPKVKL